MKKKENSSKIGNSCANGTSLNFISTKSNPIMSILFIRPIGKLIKTLINIGCNKEYIIDSLPSYYDDAAKEFTYTVIYIIRKQT